MQKLPPSIYHQAGRTARNRLARIRRSLLGVTFLEPNYSYFDRFNATSIIVDVGCGHIAEFSRHLIAQHNLRAFGVDPTRKHAADLRQLQESSHERFQHLPVAVTRQNGWLTFHESRRNESGSILADHHNILNDGVETYQVESVTLPELARRVNAARIDLIKLDLEGAEYELLSHCHADELGSFNQIFVEFHHHCTNYTVHDTMAIVRRIQAMNFKVFTSDQHNYLFYR